MKHLIYFSFLFFCNALKAQSKKETVEWLNNKFTLSAVYELQIFKYQSTITFKEDGSFAIKTEELSKKDNHLVNTTYEYGNLKDFNPNSVKIYKFGEFFFIQAKCTNTKGCVRKSGGYPEDNRIAEGVGFGAIRTEADNNIENRMLKAIKHLIVLVGGKTEAF